MGGVDLVPEDSQTKQALATQIYCWAQDPATGFTDERVDALSCCRSGFIRIPPDVCADYGPLPFTSRGQEITCDDGMAGFALRDILATDVTLLDPNTCEPAGPAAPESLTAGTVTDTTIDLAWGASDGAVMYEVRWTGADGTSGSALVSGQTVYQITGLTAETEYTIHVAGIDRQGRRGPYAETTATTAAAA